jgi:hypothetical protein
MTERFESVAAQIEHMEQWRLPKDAQLSFARRALELRFPKGTVSGSSLHNFSQPGELKTLETISGG